MMSLMTSQCDVIFGILYSCLNDIATFSVIQVVVFYQSSSNFTHIYSLTQHVGVSMSKVKELHHKFKKLVKY